MLMIRFDKQGIYYYHEAMDPELGHVGLYPEEWREQLLSVAEAVLRADV